MRAGGRAGGGSVHAHAGLRAGNEVALTFRVIVIVIAHGSRDAGGARCARGARRATAARRQAGQQRGELGRRAEGAAQQSDDIVECGALAQRLKDRLDGLDQRVRAVREREAAGARVAGPLVQADVHHALGGARVDPEGDRVFAEGQLAQNGARAGPLVERRNVRPQRRHRQCLVCGARRTPRDGLRLPLSSQTISMTDVTCVCHLRTDGCRTDDGAISEPSRRQTFE